MARKACSCGQPKRPGSPKWCTECWLRTQPIPAREAERRRRLRLVPEELRRKRCPESLWPPGRRWCAGCQTFVLLGDCTGSRCKTCASVAAHGTRTQAEYEITREEFDRLFAAQKGRCALCGRIVRRRRMAVDHDHRTGAIRGLLCPDPDWGCNLKVVARFDADPDPPAMALRLYYYLTDPPAQKVLARQ